jgi:hypothetical protein
MINFVQTSANRVHGFHGQYAEKAGLLRTPHSGHRVEKALELGMIWAMDNGCFVRYEPKNIISMMQRFRGLPHCKFMVAPDSVGNHDETLIMFRAWLGTIQSYGYPVAFVLQNGVSIETVPFGSIQAVFIGGDDAFKYSEAVREIVIEAKKRGVWVHMGRVNTINRIRYAMSIGCDSFDGTSYCIAPQINIQKHAPHYAGNRQMNLWEMEKVA